MHLIDAGVFRKETQTRGQLLPKIRRLKIHAHVQDNVFLLHVIASFQAFKALQLLLGVHEIHNNVHACIPDRRIRIGVPVVQRIHRGCGTIELSSAHARGQDRAEIGKLLVGKPGIGLAVVHIADLMHQIIRVIPPGLLHGDLHGKALAHACRRYPDLRAVRHGCFYGNAVRGGKILHIDRKVDIGFRLHGKDAGSTGIHIGIITA